MRKTAFECAKTKAQISCIVTMQLISAFVFAIKIVLSLYFLNFKPLAIFCDCTARSVFDLVRNTKTGFLTTWLNISLSFLVLHNFCIKSFDFFVNIYLYLVDLYFPMLP